MDKYVSTDYISRRIILKSKGSMFKECQKDTLIATEQKQNELNQDRKEQTKEKLMRQFTT